MASDMEETLDSFEPFHKEDQRRGVVKGIRSKSRIILSYERRASTSHNANHALDHFEIFARDRQHKGVVTIGNETFQVKTEDSVSYSLNKNKRWEHVPFVEDYAAADDEGRPLETPDEGQDAESSDHDFDDSDGSASSAPADIARPKIHVHRHVRGIDTFKASQRSENTFRDGRTKERKPDEPARTAARVVRTRKGPKVVPGRAHKAKTHTSEDALDLAAADYYVYLEQTLPKSHKILQPKSLPGTCRCPMCRPRGLGAPKRVHKYKESELGEL